MCAAWVRVRPAFAGEGRYFVRVPEGTNRDRFAFEGDNMTDRLTPGEPGQGGRHADTQTCRHAGRHRHAGTGKGAQAKARRHWPRHRHSYRGWVA